MSCQFLDPCGGGLRGSRRYEVVARNRGRARREAREDIVIPYIFLFSKCISPSSQLSLYWLALARIGRYKSNTARKRIEVRYLHYNRQQVSQGAAETEKVLFAVSTTGKSYYPSIRACNSAQGFMLVLQCKE